MKCFTIHPHKFTGFEPDDLTFFSELAESKSSELFPDANISIVPTTCLGLEISLDALEHETSVKRLLAALWDAYILTRLPL